jgi:hypothetical protein
MKKLKIFASIFVCAMLLSVTMFPGVMAAYTGTKFVGDLPSGVATLSAHWKLDETTGSTAYDETDYDNDGTIYGATINQPGKIVTSFDFDGANDYVSVPTAVNLNFGANQDFSISAWVSCDSAGRNGGRIIEKWQSGGVGYILQVDSSGYPGFGIMTSEHSYLLWDTASIVGAGWTHVCGIRYGENIYLYVNGELADSYNAADVDYSLSNLNPLYLGGTTEYFDGKIDDVRIYLDDYYPTASLIAHWTLEETTGTTAYDSADSHHGTHVGAPTIMQAGKVDSYCYYFDNNDWVSVPDHDNLDFTSGEDFSIFLWYKSSSGTNKNFLEKLSTAGYSLSTTNIGGGADALYATVDLGATTVTRTGTTDIRDGNWHHVGMVRQGDSLEIWVDGFSEGSTAGASGDISNSVALLFGNTENNPQFGVYLDDIRIYSEAVVPAT